jgi:hypothetical protein
MPFLVGNQVKGVKKHIILWADSGKTDNPKSVDFWTSGYSRNGSKFAWCPTGDFIPDFGSFPNSLQSKLSPLGVENCLLSKNSEKLIEVVAEDCNSKQNFICAVSEKTASKN